MASIRYYIVVGYNPSKSYAFPLGGDPVIIKLISQEEGQNLLKDIKPFEPKK